MMTEPILDDVDRAAWRSWSLTCRLHGRSLGHHRRVESARRVIDQALGESATPCVSWSGGKDSTALAHLVVVDRGARAARLVSEKDDLDFPGEESYVRSLAVEWGAALDIVHPPESPLAFLRAAAERGAWALGDDLHARTAELSKRCFYGVMEAACRGADLVMMGLRTEESPARNALRASRGRSYTIRTGQRRAIPLADWRGIDVYAYLDAAGVDLLPLYRCIGFLHAREPWRVRKSWWLPGGASVRYGQVEWLRRYWPSLYATLDQMTRDARRAA